MNIDFTYTQLDNGLRIVIHPDRSLPIVCINIAYHVGSKDEKSGKTGFAHLFEHLMFDGSRNVPRGAFDRYCEQAGGYNNAYTNEDKTNYYMVLPSNQLEVGLWLESDRLLGLQLTEQGLETQKSVVMEEKRQRVDNQPYGTMEERIAQLSYTVHPYNHPIIGSMEDIASATFEDVVRFHKTYYTPDNAVLTIAGDVDASRAVKLAQRYFGDIQRGNSVPRVAAAEPPRNRETRAIVEDDVPLPAVFMAFNICEETGGDLIPLDMLSDLFGYGESSRLHQRLVYERNIANQASAFIDVREHPGLMMFYAMANPGISAQALEDAINEEINAALTQGMHERELNRIKNKIESAYYQSMQSISLRADRLTHHALMYDQPERLTMLIHEYLSTGIDSLINTGRRYLRPENRTVLHYVPRNEAPLPETEYANE